MSGEDCKSMASRREKVGTVILSALIVGGITVPAQAAGTPGSKITAVPDAGARPEASGLPLLPSGRLAMPPTLPSTPIDFLKAQVDAARVETETLSERINALQLEQDRARISAAWANQGSQDAEQKLKDAKEKAAKAATEAYKAATELPPPLQDGSVARDLNLLIPRQRPGEISEAAAFDLQRAQAAADAAKAELAKATEAEAVITAEVTTTTATFQQRDAARLLLEQRLVTLQSEEDRRIERDAAKLRADYNVGQSNKGLVAAEGARKAVLFALQQLGKPYRFAEEGPKEYDCSGLSQTSYRQAGVLLPRVANDQYYAYRAKPVALDALLPGDLLFFARDPRDWRTIHHVMIYIGDGKVVHAPKTGDVVKISKIDLSSSSPVDFAVRVIDAIPVQPEPKPTPTPTPTPSPTPAPTPTPTPTATVTETTTIP
jgi:cell wall-associated NlpC family hydrolase